jgi:hypothetical protein
MAFLSWLKKRLLEPSSWAGIGLFVDAIDKIGVDGINQTTVGMLLTALVAMCMPGKQIADAPDQLFPHQDNKN